MSRNGPFAILFHALFVTFMLAPLVVVCLVAFTPAPKPPAAQPTSRSDWMVAGRNAAISDRSSE